MLLVLDHTDRNLVGQQFYSFTASFHTTSHYTTFRGAIGAGSGKTISVSTHSQGSYDSAAAGATITSTDTTNFWAKTGDTLNLEKSLKAHTRVVGSDTLYLWEDRLPHPEKRWRYAVADIIIGNHGGSFTFDDTWNKFNFFRIHNLTQSSCTINFGSTPHHTFSIAKNSQRCVRRDTVTTGYDSSYKYVWKVNAGDPRFITFNSHDGSLAQTMEVNNVTNPSWLYRFFGELDSAGLIHMDQHTFTDIGADYQAAGILPTITTGTLAADLVYTKGKFSKVRQIASSGTVYDDTYTFSSFSSLAALLGALGYTVSTVSNKLKIAQDTGSTVNNLAGYETNLFQRGDNFRVLDVVHNDQYLETEFWLPKFDSVAAASPTSSAFYLLKDNQVSIRGSVDGVYAGHTTTVAQLGTSIAGAMPIENNQMAGTPTISVNSTTEGPVATWTEEWYTGTANPNNRHAGSADNLSWQTILDVSLNSSGRIEFKQHHLINKVKYGSTSWDYAGWPTDYALVGGYMVNRYDRLFEGGRKVRKHGVKDSDGTHNDVTADPVGVSGADFALDPVETTTDTDIKTQCSRFTISVPSFSSGSTTKANIPIVLPDAAHHYHANRADLTWLASNLATVRQSWSGGDMTTVTTVWSGITGNDYLRMNLLREHFNDLVTQCKRVKRIRTLDFGQVYFGEVQLPAYNRGMFDTSGDTTTKIAPKTSYSLWRNTPLPTMTAAWTALGATISTDANLPNTVAQLSRVNEVTTPPSSAFASYQSTAIQAELSDVRWVSISNAMAKAASLGFKFRMVAWSRSINYSYTTTADTNQSFTQSSSGSYVLQGVARLETGSPSSRSYPTPTLTGSSLTQAADLQAFFHANNTALNPASQMDVEHYKNYSSAITTETSPSTRYAQLVSESAITLHLYDTSVSGNIGTLAKQLVQSGSTPASGFVDNGAATTTALAQGTHNLTPSSSTQQHRYLLELIPTAHSA